MSTKCQRFHPGLCLIAPLLLGACAHSQGEREGQPRASVGERLAPECSSEHSPYRDLDFLVGHWDFFGTDGKKVGEHVYSKREQGCLILEEWTSVSGSTGTGMNFVDPETGRWRQVWMSPLFHIDYSGGLEKTGAIVLEGRIYPHAGGESGPVRGVWTRQHDGSVKQEFLQFDDETDAWETFFVGVSRRKQQ